jgi:hypothetical protein
MSSSLLPPPPWATWQAQDADGAWWCFEAEPNQHDTGWYENEVGRYRKLGQGAPNPHWRDTLAPVSQPTATPPIPTGDEP